MEFDLEAGLIGHSSRIVTPDVTAQALGSGGVPVLSTPMLIALLEQAARNAVEGRLPEGYTTVGTLIDVSHLAATPVGLEVRAKAVLTEVDGRRLAFDVEAHDGFEKVAEGRHGRFIVNLEKFMERAMGKAHGG